MSVVLIIGVGEYDGAFLSFGPLFFIEVKGPVDDGVNLPVIPNHAANHYLMHVLLSFHVQLDIVWLFNPDPSIYPLKRSPKNAAAFCKVRPS